jgi:hypothetical protein
LPSGQNEEVEENSSTENYFGFKSVKMTKEPVRPKYSKIVLTVSRKLI